MAMPPTYGCDVAVTTDQGLQQQEEPVVRTRSTKLSSAQQQTVTGKHIVSAAAAALPQVKEKRNIGRPLAFKGDINCKDLTEAERRRIRRRVANRESARRVRYKRQQALEEMQERMNTMRQHTTAIAAEVQQVHSQKAALANQLSVMQHKWQACLEEIKRLREHVSGDILPVATQSSAFEEVIKGVDVRMPTNDAPPLMLQQQEFSAFMPHVSSGGSIAKGTSAVTSSPPGSSSTSLRTASAVHGPVITITTAGPTCNVVTASGAFANTGVQDFQRIGAPLGDVLMPAAYAPAPGDFTGQPIRDLAMMPSLPERLPSLHESLDWLMP